MIILPDPVDNKKVRAAIQRANEGDGYEVRLHLQIGEHDASHRLEQAEWGQSEMPITLDAQISGFLSQRLQDAKVKLIAEIDGAPIPQLLGEKTAVLPSNSPYSTDLLSSSAGSLANGEDAVKLGEFTEYPATPPHNIVFDVAKRLPYNRNRVVIDPISNVTLHLVGSTETPGFLASETAGDVLSRLADSTNVGYEYRDTADGGLRAFIPRPVSERSLPQESFRDYQAALLPDWAGQRPRAPLVRYSAVRVYRQDDAGRLLWERIVEVPYPPGARLPHKNRTLDIPFEDSSGVGPENGRRLAIRKAYELAVAAHVGDELTLPAYDPLIESDDRIAVTEQYRDDVGTWEIAWLMRVETYKHMFGTGTTAGTSGGRGASLDTAISYTAAIAHEERIKAPAMIVPRATSGVIPTPRDPYGVEGDDLYFDEPLDWIEAEGDDLIFHSAAPANVEGDSIIVEK